MLAPIGRRLKLTGLSFIIFILIFVENCLLNMIFHYDWELVLIQRLLIGNTGKASLYYDHEKSPFIQFAYVFFCCCKYETPHSCDTFTVVMKHRYLTTAAIQITWNQIILSFHCIKIHKTYYWPNFKANSYYNQNSTL